MAKFACVCGEAIRTSGDIPNPQEWHLISDEELETAWETSVEQVSRTARFVYRCPRSGHLWIFWDGIDDDPTLYELKWTGWAGGPTPSTAADQG